MQGPCSNCAAARRNHPAPGIITGGVVHVSRSKCVRYVDEGGSVRSPDLHIVCIQRTGAALRVQIGQRVGQKDAYLRLVIESRAAQKRGVAGRRSADDVNRTNWGRLHKRQLQPGSAGQSIRDKPAESSLRDARPSWVCNTGGRESAGPAAGSELHAIYACSGTGCRSRRTAAGGVRYPYFAGVTAGGGPAILQLVGDDLPHRRDLVGEGQVAARSQKQVAIGVHPASEVKVGAGEVVTIAIAEHAEFEIRKQRHFHHARQIHRCARCRG